MASRPNFWQRFLHKNTPSREEVLSSRWLKPFGHRVAHSELWRFTRRSVPRAVFAGLFIGIFLMVPGLQIVGAADLADHQKQQDHHCLGDDEPSPITTQRRQ